MTKQEQEIWVKGCMYGMYTKSRMDGVMAFEANYKDLHADCIKLWEEIARYELTDVMRKNKQ